MIQIQLLHGQIQIDSDEVAEKEDDLLVELNKVLSFVILIYKRRIEKLKHEKLSPIDETVLNQRIKNALIMIPLNVAREFINEVEP